MTRHSPPSLFRQGDYSLGWVKDFYTQAGIWWGADPQETGEHAARLQTIERLGKPGPKRILDLGAGSGLTAAALADAGHTVVGVELNPTDIGYAQVLLDQPRRGSLSILAGDYYTLELTGRFDVVCCWQGFGIGSDADQRRLLRRISQEWLAHDGRALLDVYNPPWAILNAGEEKRLPPLEGVAGSVEMIERSHFDPLHCRWIDEWQPVEDPSQTRQQTVRCYSPADLLLLLEGTGLSLQRVEVGGEELDLQPDKISLAGPLMDAWSYLAVLVHA